VVNAFTTSYGGNDDSNTSSILGGYRGGVRGGREAGSDAQRWFTIPPLTVMKDRSEGSQVRNFTKGNNVMRQRGRAIAKTSVQEGKKDNTWEEVILVSGKVWPAYFDEGVNLHDHFGAICRMLWLAVLQEGN